MEGAASGPTHPVTRMDVTATAGTAGPILPEDREETGVELECDEE